jgi:CelD/BcsL family acetyltransferase involved in cellulose biosynthesis
MAALIATDRTDQSSMAHMATAIEQPTLALEVFVGWEQVEEALGAGGLRADWDELMVKDPVAGFYQTPLWCVTWYRCYRDEYEPFLMTARRSGQLLGLVALARERSSMRLVFAGENMADYRDFICAEGARREVVELFLPRIMAESSSGVFVVGQTQPESETVELVRRWAASRRMRTITRTHPCWRFKIGDPEEIQELYKKKTIRQMVAYYQRRGGLKFKRISECWEWEGLKHIFFQQHCLRQAFSERTISFAEPTKQEFYCQLFESLAPEVHFSGLWAEHRPISFMFCFAYQGVLYYGAPCFDLLEQKHSPGLIHILEAISQCRNEGYREVDLTIGSASFKSRIGNYCTTLPSVEVYGSLPTFSRSFIRKVVADTAKAVLFKITRSQDAWQAVKDRSSELRYFLRRLRETPPRRVLTVGLARLWRVIFYWYRGEIFRLRPEELISAEPSLSHGETCEFRKNRLEDYLTLEGKERRAMGKSIQSAVKRIANGHTLHTVLVGGQLAHYGWSYRPKEPAWLPETETHLPFDEGAVSLYEFYTCEAYRGRHLYRANLAHIAQTEFSEGARSVHIVCEKGNAASRQGIKSVGFTSYATHVLIRFLWWKRRRVYQATTAMQE